MAKTSNKNTLRKSDKGTVFEIKRIPSNMFEFYVYKRRTFKDGTSLWDIGVSPKMDTTKSFIFDKVRGTIETAEQRLDEIIEMYNIKK